MIANSYYKLINQTAPILTSTFSEGLVAFNPFRKLRRLSI
jgi:hypothetical protein